MMTHEVSALLVFGGWERNEVTFIALVEIRTILFRLFG